MASTDLRILGIAGALRRASFNRGLIRTAQELAPAGVEFAIAEIGDLPHYDGDVEAVGLPDTVQRFKAQLRQANAILIATPEYNASISGVLKNAIDWGSRPYTDNVWRGKPVAIMGASGGMGGTVRSQLALRQTLGNLDTFVMGSPVYLLPLAAAKFDADGNLTDEEQRGRVKSHVEALIKWAERFAD